MKSTRVDFEERFHVALRRIVAYMSPEQLRRRSEKEYGLGYEEALEMAYENVQGEALAALKGYRRRRPSRQPQTPKVDAALGKEPMR